MGKAWGSFLLVDFFDDLEYRFNLSILNGMNNPFPKWMADVLGKRVW